MAFQAQREEIETKQYADYKDTAYLRLFVNTHAKIQAKKRTGVSSKHQRDIALAIKRARFMGFLPYIAA